jgi:hypothetical protein
MPGVTGTLVMDLYWCGGRSVSARCWIIGRTGRLDAEDGVLDIVYFFACIANNKQRRKDEEKEI